MYTLYYAPGLASMAPHLILREIGAEHRLVLIDRSVKEHKGPEYLALNPNGRIPTFDHDGHVIYEAAAICLHLADLHPEARLIPPVGDPARSDLYKWLIFLTNTLQADLWQFYRPEFYVEESRFVEYRATMEQHIARHLGILNDALRGRAYFIGDAPTLPDFYLLMLARWCRELAQPLDTFPEIHRLVLALHERPAVREVLEVEKLQVPHY